ncbi:ThuA domain-containing protein [Propionibacteriaceae bacterium G1746]|uniref:ThuA domain-containing protein n=1 Tax=Aestuariimicrobium sp. G57 TaxID=3418485 RepID=UPI003C18484D
MSNIVVFSGVAPFDDPWHPFHETSTEIARVLDGHDVVVRDAHPEVLASLDGVDLLIVNAGGGGPDAVVPDPADWADAYAAAEAWHGTGGAILAVHTGLNSFTGWGAWPQIIGGRWVRGTSGHPERSVAVFEPAAGADQHPILVGLDQVQVYDERYWHLAIGPDVTPLLHHETGEQFHVMAWARDPGHGQGRVVYDGLGHDARSYHSAPRRDLLHREVEWLLHAR